MDHSTISKMRKRLGRNDAFETMFRFVLGVVEKSGLLKGKVMGADSTYSRADASMKTTFGARDTGEGSTGVHQAAGERGRDSGADGGGGCSARPNRKGKKTSNVDRKSKTDEDA
ncbi:MAG: hypothetical protein U0441_30195 [Polyangiaceae bacterium]